MSTPYAQTAPLHSIPVARARRLHGVGSDTGNAGRRRYRSLKIEGSVLYFKHLPPGFTPEELTQLCQAFGQVKYAKILRDPETNEDVHKGMVKFVSPLASVAALSDLNGKVVKGSSIVVTRTDVETHTERATLKVLVRNIPSEVEEARVQKVFQRYGDIDVLTVIDRDVTPGKWSCTIRYTSFEAASAAKAGMNQKTLAPDTDPIVVKFSKSKEDGESHKLDGLHLSRRRSLRVREISLPHF